MSEQIYGQTIITFVFLACIGTSIFAANTLYSVIKVPPYTRKDYLPNGMILFIFH